MEVQTTTPAVGQLSHGDQQSIPCLGPISSGSAAGAGGSAQGDGCCPSILLLFRLVMLSSTVKISLSPDS